MKLDYKTKLIKVEYGDIKFKFEDLVIKSAGSPDVAINLMKDNQFIRNLTNIIHSETEKVMKGGVIQG